MVSCLSPTLEEGAAASEHFCHFSVLYFWRAADILGTLFLVKEHLFPVLFSSQPFLLGEVLLKISGGASWSLKLGMWLQKSLRKTSQVRIIPPNLSVPLQFWLFHQGCVCCSQQIRLAGDVSLAGKASFPIIFRHCCPHDLSPFGLDLIFPNFTFVSRKARLF